MKEDWSRRQLLRPAETARFGPFSISRVHYLAPGTNDKREVPTKRTTQSRSANKDNIVREGSLDKEGAELIVHTPYFEK